MVAAPREHYRMNNCRKQATTHNSSMSSSPASSTMGDSRFLATNAYDIPRYLIDVTVLILKAIRSDLTNGEHVGYDSFLQSLIHNIFVISKLSHSVLLAGLLYLLRFRFLLAKHRSSLRKRIDVLSPSLTFVLFIAAMSLASKFHLDTTTHNRRWSDNSGVSIQTINRVEAILLEVIEFRLTVSKAAFDDWVNFLFSAKNLQAYRKQVQVPSAVRRIPEETPEGMNELLREFERNIASRVSS